MSQEFDDTFSSTRAHGRAWLHRISWGAVLAVGLLVYELTHRPTFGLAIVLAKFGWDDFVTGFWLARRDPCRPRGAACGLFYTAAGLGRITLAAFVTAVVLLWITHLLGERPPRELRGVGLTLALGLGLLGFLPLMGALLALGGGVKVWLDTDVHASRRSNAWPPYPPRGRNRLGTLVLPALLVPLASTAAVTWKVGLLPMLALALIETLMIWSLLMRVAALTPGDCWPELIHGDDYEPVPLLAHQSPLLDEPAPHV